MGRRYWNASFSLAIILATGCSRDHPDPYSAVRLGDSDQNAVILGDETLEYDFGPVLAQGQTLRHEFALANPTKQTLQLFRAMALTPCCSSIEPLPGSIAPGATVKMAVAFKPGHSSGRKQAKFVVRTNSSIHPTLVFAVTALLYTELSVIQLEGSSTLLPIGQAGTQRLRIVQRRVGEGGRGWPDSVAAIPPLGAVFTGIPKESRTSDGLIEASRDVDVAIPVMKEPGFRSGGLIFRWADGFTHQHSVAWEASPLIRIVPSGLVLRPSASRTTRTVLVTSSDRPFRVTNISGSLLADTPELLPSDLARSHQLRLVIDPSLTSVSGATDLSITTDHPDQPTIRFSVLILPAEQGPDG